MKLFGGGKSCFVLMISVVIFLSFCEKSIAADVGSDEEVVVAADEEEGGGGEGGDGHHHEDHEDHGSHDGGQEDGGGGGGEDEEASLSGEVSSSLNDHEEHHDHHHAVVVRGHTESCGGDESGSCDTGAGLICVEEVGKCECDKNAGEVFSEELGKCEQAPHHVIQEVKDNSLEEDGNSGEEKNEDGKEEKEEVNMQNEEEASPPTTTTTTTTQATVVAPEKQNSLEEENEEKVEEEEAPVMEIQHRSDEKEEENKDEKDESGEGEMESGTIVGGGKCSNVNCEETLGRYSKCNEESGECECNDVENLERPLILQNGKCLINRQIEDPCSSHDECTATIQGRGWCHMDPKTMNRFCQCEMFHYFDASLNECLPFASDGVFSPCKTDMQCTGYQAEITGHGLGPHARCSEETGRCICKMGPNGQKTFLHENYCFYQMMPGEHCDLDRECEVSFPGQDVGCMEGQCMCRNGDNITAVSCPTNDILGGSKRIDGLFDDNENSVEDSDGVLDNIKSAMGLDLSNFVFIMIIGAVVLLFIVILSVFIVKKRHKYTVVKTREPTEEPASP